VVTLPGAARRSSEAPVTRSAKRRNSCNYSGEQKIGPISSWLRNHSSMLWHGYRNACIHS
jgi:hypothetical protein